MTEVSRTALVTGGGSGMGEATCNRFARDGKAVGVFDINGDGAARVANEISKAGGRALALQADISDRSAVDAAVAKLRKQFGPVTILVNNAGLDDWSAFAAITDEIFNRMLSVNLKGMLYTSQAVLPDMEAARWGRIINLSALGATICAPGMIAYYASKGGVISLTRGMAAELGAKGITVNSVSPGFIDTPMARRAIDEKRFPVPYEQILASYPIPRLGKPEDIAAACAFFASEEAGYITAQLLGVNGGAAV